MVQQCSDSSLRIDIRLQLYLDLLQSLSSSNAGTDSTSSTVTKQFLMNSTEHVSMQESSGKCYLPHGVVEALFAHRKRPSLIFFVPLQGHW